MHLQDRFYSLLSKISQEKPSRNRTAVKILRALGYEPARIRKAMATLEDIQIHDLAEGRDLSASIVYATIAGKRTGQKRFGPLTNQAKELLADALGLDVPELFPENGDNNVPKVATRAA
jgi:hypothetical protein